MYLKLKTEIKVSFSKPVSCLIELEYVRGEGRRRTLEDHPWKAPVWDSQLLGFPYALAPRPARSCGLSWFFVRGKQFWKAQAPCQNSGNQKVSLCIFGETWDSSSRVVPRNQLQHWAFRPMIGWRLPWHPVLAGVSEFVTTKQQMTMDEIEVKWCYSSDYE